MSDSFQFRCPFCEQDLEIPSEEQGEVVKCPACSEEIVPEKNQLLMQSQFLKQNYFLEKNLEKIVFG